MIYYRMNCRILTLFRTDFLIKYPYFFSALSMVNLKYQKSNQSKTVLLVYSKKLDFYLNIQGETICLQQF